LESENKNIVIQREKTEKIFKTNFNNNKIENAPKFNNDFDLNDIKFENIPKYNNDLNRYKLNELRKDYSAKQIIFNRTRFTALKNDDNQDKNKDTDKIKDQNILHKNTKNEVTNNNKIENSKRTINESKSTVLYRLRNQKKDDTKNIVNEPKTTVLTTKYERSNNTDNSKQVIKDIKIINEKNRTNDFQKRVTNHLNSVSQNKKQDKISDIEDKRTRRYDAGTFKNSIRNKYKNQKK
jgi:hypothetical protein